MTCHIAADDPRFDGVRRSRSRRIPYSAALGDVQRNGRWERRHKFSDFGCTVCHDGQGRGLETGLRARRGSLLARAAARLRDAGDLAQGLRAEAQGQGVHGGQLRPVPHRRELRRHADGRPRAAAVLREELLRLPPHRRALGRHARRPTSPRSARSSRSTTSGSRSSSRAPTCATSFMPKFNLTPDEVQGAGGVPEEPPRHQLHRDRRSQRYRAKADRRAPRRSGERRAGRQRHPADDAAGEQLIADRACTACHKLGRARRRHRAGSDLRRPDQATSGWIATTSRTRAPWCPTRSCRPSASPERSSSAMTAYLAEPDDAAAARHRRRADLHGALRPLPRRKGRRPRPDRASTSIPSPRDLTKAAFMNSKPRGPLRRSRFSNGVAGTSMPAWGKVLDEHAGHGRARLRARDLHQGAAPRAEAAQRARSTTRWRRRGDPSRARRGDLRPALHRLPRPQGRRQGPELARHPAAAAQPAQRRRS